MDPYVEEGCKGLRERGLLVLRRRKEIGR